MYRLKKITALVLALGLSLSTAVFAVACGGGEESSSPVESSQSSSSVEESSEYTLTVTAVKEDGTPLSGVSFTLVGRRYEETVATNEEGKAVFQGAEGVYTLTLMDGLPEYHIADAYSKEITLTQNAETVFTVEDMTPNGSLEHPFIFSVNDEGEMEATIPANTTYHYEVYRAVNQSLRIENENVEVMFKDTTYTPANGKVEVAFGLTDMRDMAYFTLANTSNEVLTITMKLVATSASDEMELTIGQEVTASVTAEEGVEYVWTATTNGILKILSNSENKIISVSVAGVTETISAEETQLEIEVNAGDKVMVSVIAAQGAVGTISIVFTANFTAA